MSKVRAETAVDVKESRPRAKKGVIREWTEVILGALALFLVFRIFFFQAFQIPSGSMEDTLLVGDYLFANKFIYGAKIPVIDVRLPKFRSPHRKDIVVFNYPNDPQTYIKRVIGLPGETLEIKERVIYIDGEPIDEPYTKYQDRMRPRPDFVDSRTWQRSGNMDYFGPVVIPEGRYFMMGDNRDDSEDSRFRGPIPGDGILGKAEILYFSWDKQDKEIRFSRIGDIIR